MAGTERIPTASLRPVSASSFGYDEARHLLWRAGFGGTADQIRTLAVWGPERAVDCLVNVGEIGGYPAPTPDAFDGSIMRALTRAEVQRYRQARENGDEETVAMFRRRRQAMQRSDRGQMRALQRWWLARMIESPRPLEEKMTLMWHGHFATSYRSVENSYHMFLQNQTFRAHAVGNFGELLFRIIRDPAMLQYLNNDRNVASAPNENLARELMELFSMGEGTYSERDIKEGARALTGYTYEGNGFVFREAVHDGGTKRILGKVGPMDGDDFVRAILETRACGIFVASRLYEFFVGPIPAPGSRARAPVERVVRGLASTFVRSKYEIAPVLRELFRSEHFYDGAVRMSRIKSPAELVAGAVRTLRTPVRDLDVLCDAMSLMGQELFFPPSVAGWGGGRSWINTSTLYVRQNVMTFLLTGKTPSGFDPLARVERYDPDVVLSALAEGEPGAERDPERVVTFLVRFMLGESSVEAKRRSLVEFVDRSGGRVRDDVVTGVMALVTAMPEYQLC